MPNNAFYWSKAWRAVRLLRLKMAGWRCEAPLGQGRCNADLRRQAKPQVHHLIEPETRPDLALDVNNLRAWCLPCHNAKHDRSTGKQRPEVGSDGFPMDGNWSNGRINS
jgi:5-methylcytosine-specific restriction protein A